MYISAFFDSPIGKLYIIVENKLIHKISFTFNEELNSHPQSNRIGFYEDYQLLDKCTKQLSEYFNGSRKQFSLPINYNGTQFQNDVWKQLSLIPYGKTINYLQLSKQLNNTKAIRAVGNANGKNRIAIIIPCHRVIGSNGTLVGYAGELWRKKWLLDHEAQHAHGVQSLFG